MSDSSGNSFDAITLEVLWARLISMVDEAAATFLRASFSTLVRDCNDYAVVLTDAQGRSVAQNTQALPSFICTLPNTVKSFIQRFPLDTLAEGDALLTNDPWVGTGHIHDFSLVMPIFSQGQVIGFTAIAAHFPDIGGRIRSSGIREIYEEGLQIPMMKLIDHGRRDDNFLQLFRRNVRVPDQCVGDLFAAVGGCSALTTKVQDLVEQEKIDFMMLGEAIQQRSESTLRNAISKVPDGVYRNVILHDGFDERIVLDCKVNVSGDRLDIDYTGSSPQLERSVNVVPGYTFAYSAYGVKTALAPEVPNNDGSFRPMTTYAPEGTVLNPRYPAATGARNMVGHLTPVAVMGALAPVLGGHIGAQGSANSSFQMAGEYKGRRFATVSFVNGGQGANAFNDGASGLSFPSNLSNTPIEVLENLAPVRILHRRRRRGSGGNGQHKGGDGVDLRFEYIGEQSTACSFLLTRWIVPPKGLEGGEDGKVAEVLVNHQKIDPSQPVILQNGDVVDMRTAGGGGYGAPL